MRNFVRFKKSKLLYSDIFCSAYMSYKLNDNLSLIYTYFLKLNNGFLKRVSNCYKKMRRGKQKHFKLVFKRVRNWKLGQQFSSYVLLRVFKLFYFNIKFHQFRKYFVNASKKRGAFVDNFLFLLEMRIDMFLFRSFPCFSLGFIRQFILHTGLFVNNKHVQRIGFSLRHGDYITFLGNRIVGSNIRDKLNCRKKLKCNTSLSLRKYLFSFFSRRRKLKKPFFFLRPQYSFVDYNLFYLLVNQPQPLGFSSKVFYPFGLDFDLLYSIVFEKFK